MESENTLDARLPSWLERYAFYEEDRARAYDTVSPQLRVMLKKTVARLHSIYGTLPHNQVIEQHFDAFTLRQFRQPVSCAFVCVPEKYLYPQCFIAALVPPLLAGVKLVVPFFITGENAIATPLQGTLEGSANGQCVPSSPLPEAQNALLAALDLAGVERAYLLPASECHDAIVEFFASFSVKSLGEAGQHAAASGLEWLYGAGKMVLLGSFPGWEPLALLAARLGIPCTVLAQEPRYIPLESPAAPLASSGPSAFCPLPCLDTENHDVWLWPGLEPESFCAGGFSVSKPYR